MTPKGLISFFLLISLASLVRGHGRLTEPPSRASAWRFGFPTPIDYQDNEGFCGGFNYQYSVNDGRCGICGDAFDEDPRPHEVGGIYATGTIVREYSVDEIITVHVDVTANHKGHFEFKLCPNNNIHQEATQECLDKYPLELADGSGFNQWIDSNVGDHPVQLKLPQGLTCTQCVLQWRYVAGNNWGICEDGTGAVGCGPQEEFRACADVTISNNSTRIHQILSNTQHKKGYKNPGRRHNQHRHQHGFQPRVHTKVSTESQVHSKESTEKKCSAVGIWGKVAGMNTWCQNNCMHTPSFCPKSQCVCSSVENHSIKNEQAHMPAHHEKNRSVPVRQL